MQIIKNYVDYIYAAEYNGGIVFMFAYPYTPYKDVTVDAYYLASHKCYALCKQIIDALREAGYEAAHANDVPLKPLAVKSGLAYKIGRNGLAYHKGYGSRFCIGAIKIAMLNARCSALNESQEKISINSDSHCALCAAHCALACPAQAIGETKPDYTQCLREHMNNPEIMSVDSIRSLGGRVLGCDICQRACPCNSGEYTDMPPELAEACKDLTDPQNIKKLTALVGHNIARTNRIKRLAGVGKK